MPKRLAKKRISEKDKKFLIESIIVYHITKMVVKEMNKEIRNAVKEWKHERIKQLKRKK